MTLFRNAVSKLLFPTLEGDLNKYVTKELAKAHTMTDCMLAPTAYAYEKTWGGIAATAPRNARVVKVDVPILGGRGLFQ